MGDAHHAHAVLVLADHNNLRQAYASMLRFEGVEAVTAWGVPDAVGALGRGFRPCAMLLDLGIDGVGVREQLRSKPELETVPVVTITHRRARTGATLNAGVLQAPVDSAALLAAVNRHCVCYSPEPGREPLP